LGLAEKKTVTLLSRFTRYLEGHWDFRDMLEHIRDSRKTPDIPSATVFLSVFGMHTLRLGSINELESQLNMPARWDPWVGIGKRKPSADTIGYSLDRYDLAGPRQILAEVGKAAKRKKVFRRLYCDLHWVAALDGVETHKSRKRCCDRCCTRELKIGDEIVTEYYHREVVMQLVGVTPALNLDVEPVLPGETEVAAALRLPARIHRALPRFIDVLTMDAFYLQAPFVSQALEFGYGLVIVLKNEERDLYQDADGLFQAAPAETIARADGQVQLWDVNGLTSWPQLGRKVRVVRALEDTLERERVAQKWTYRQIVRDWRWAVIFPDGKKPPPELVRLWGHARWDEETRGFGELTQHWHLNHCYRHHPTAIVACRLILFLAFFLTTVFFDRNLKPAVRLGKSRIHLTLLLADDLAKGARQSFWAQPP
jgi:hypothetical protein